MSHKIFCFIIGQWGEDGDVDVIAVAEDGTILGRHSSSNLEWAKADIGMFQSRPDGQSDSPHLEDYAAYYPDGYELVWVATPEDDERVKGLIQLPVEE